MTFNLNTPDHCAIHPSSRAHITEAQVHGGRQRSREKSSWCPATVSDRSISSEKDDYNFNPYKLIKRSSRKGIR